MEETLQQPKKEEMKNEVNYNSQIKTNSIVNETNCLITQSKMIIAFYLLGTKPPWIIRIFYKL